MAKITKINDSAQKEAALKLLKILCPEAISDSKKIDPLEKVFDTLREELVKDGLSEDRINEIIKKSVDGQNN